MLTFEYKWHKKIFYYFLREKTPLWRWGQTHFFTHHTWFYSLTINPGEGGGKRTGAPPTPCLRACFISSPSNQTFELCFCKMVFISFIQYINLRIFNNLKYCLIYTIFKYFSCKSMFIQNIIPRPLMPASKGTVSVIQVTLSTKMAMTDVHWYPIKFCLIKCELDIHVLFIWTVFLIYKKQWRNSQK